MNFRKAAVAIALGAIVSGTAFAQGTGFEQRDAQIAQRIEQGIRSGQLTPREAARLQRRQANIARMEAEALSDGRISRRERARIELAQENLSRAVFREKHDAQARR